MINYIFYINEISFYLLQIFLFMIFHLSNQIFNDLHLKPNTQGLGRDEFISIRQRLIDFEKLQLSFWPSADELLAIWDNFYKFKDTYSSPVFNEPLRKKFDTLVERTMFLLYFNSSAKVILLRILKIIKGMPGIVADPKNVSLVLKSYSYRKNDLIEEIVSQIRASQPDSDYLGSQKEYSINWLFFYSFLSCILLCIAYDPLYNRNFFWHLNTNIRGYAFLKIISPILYLFVALLPIFIEMTPKELRARRIFIKVCFFSSFTLILLRLISMPFLLYMYIDYLIPSLQNLRDQLFKKLATSTLFQYWTLAYLDFFNSKNYLRLRLRHFGISSLMLLIFILYLEIDLY